MICWKCGSTIDDRAAVCVHCGAATPLGMSISQGVQKAPGDPNEPANVGFIVLSIFVPMFGIIFGAVESGNGKKRAGKAYLISGICGIVALTVIPIIITIVCTLLSIVFSFLPLLLIAFQNT
jgi:hypothetical protein